MSLVVTQGFGSDASSFNAVSITPTPSYVDVTFTTNVGPLILQAALPENWIFTTVGDIQIHATALEVIGMVVRVSITEPKAGDTYTLTFPINGLLSEDAGVFEGPNSLDFVAVAISPVIAQALSVDATHVRVIFSENVIESDALTKTNYVITSPSLGVNGVSKETDNTYLLGTDPQTPAQTYTLTVYNVRDRSENPI